MGTAFGVTRGAFITSPAGHPPTTPGMLITFTKYTAILKYHGFADFFTTSPFYVGLALRLRGNGPNYSLQNFGTGLPGGSWCTSPDTTLGRSQRHIGSWTTAPGAAENSI